MFTYLSKKLEMSGGANVRCLSWSAVDSYLACGCDNGLLKVLKIEVAASTQEGSEGNGGGGGVVGGVGGGMPLTPRGYLAVPTNITMNQTLDGHTSPVQVISWNNPYNKLTTSDSKGLIVVWMLYKGQWYEEMVNNRNKSTVRGLAWSNNGEKICIVYEDGGVIVGSADGNRLWSKELKGSPLCGVAWSPDGNQLLFPVGSGEIHVYDNEGTYLSNVKLNGMDSASSSGGNGEEQFVVAISWYSGNITSAAIKLPTLAIVFKRNTLYLLRGIEDTNHLALETNLLATCGDWSPNGDYFAVGGEPIVKRGQDPPMDQVVIFGAGGKFLHQIRILSQPCMALAWDSWSLRLAVGAGPNIYFANIRPNYKISFYAEHIFVYAFGRTDGSSHIAFWDQHKLNTQEIPGLVIDLKGNEDLCAVMTCGRNGGYNVALVNAVGAPVDNITIISLEPFMLVLTETTVCCIAENAILIWKYHMMSSQNDTLSSRRREKTFHLDDNFTGLNSVENDSEPMDYVKRPTKDPAVCADGVKHILVVVRESGKLMLYSLPHGSLISCMESIHDMNIKPRRVFFNMDGSQVALLDSIGSLSTCYVSAGSNIRGSGVVKTFDRKDIWDVMWAKDNPNLMCIMEKTRLYVIENGKLEDPIISSAYLGYFKNLQVTSILMDEIMQDPEDPKPDMVLKFETKALRDMKQLIENHTPLPDIMLYIEENSHPLLWRLMAKAALQVLNLQIAETAFVKCKDYAGVQFTKRILTIPDKLVQQAEVACFFEDYEHAEKLYLQGDRRDLAVEMWQLLGDWKRVELIAVAQSKQKPTAKAIAEMNLALGDLHAEKFEWNKARVYYEKADHSDRVFDCYLILEDYKRLQQLAESSPPYSDIVPKIAEIFGSVGLCDDSVKAYLQCEMYEDAVKIAMALGEWNLAMELAMKHNMNTGAVLAQYASYLITEGNIFQAVELFKSSNKPYSAAKIIGMMALHELQCEDMEPLIVKMLFVLCALLFEYKGKDYDFVNTSSGAGKQPATLSSMTDDISFDTYIPDYYRPPPEVYNWMRSNPWRGAEAVHYFLMASRYLYTGQFSQATRCSLQLTSYADILGEERVGTLIAISAANSRNYGICSRAFMFLEEIDETFSEESAVLFSRHQPVDSQPMKSECEKCMASIPDGVQRCPECNEAYPFCIAKGKPLNFRQNDIWICEVCKHMADEEAMQEKIVCPLCHSIKPKSSKALRKE